ncbi:MAG: diacylglycerol kinase family protein [Candidatus Saccharibacteria bacterium]|nr:diacylglycerol kinase family protein [Candidatus Saccharibacteria bacterium]
MRRGFDSLYPHHEEHHTSYGVFFIFIMYDRKLVIVQNPYNTHHSEMQAGVFDRLDAAGIAYDTITTRFSQAEDNIKDLADHLPQDAHIISAAGDGTSTQVVNAGLRAELDNAVYSFIGYGNCNDLARGQRDPLPLLQTNHHTIIHQPLSIEVNNEPWRHAPGYMTLGLTALVASGFAGTASRERMRRTTPHTKLVRSIGQVATTYLRVHDTYLPLIDRLPADRLFWLPSSRLLVYLQKYSLCLRRHSGPHTGRKNY